MICCNLKAYSFKMAVAYNVLLVESFKKDLDDKIRNIAHKNVPQTKTTNRKCSSKPGRISRKVHPIYLF
jgi:hypothetical protein